MGGPVSGGPTPWGVPMLGGGLAPWGSPDPHTRSPHTQGVPVLGGCGGVQHPVGVPHTGSP